MENAWRSADQTGRHEEGVTLAAARRQEQRLGPQVPDDGRRHVHEDAFAADLVFADVATDEAADAIEAAALPPIGERRLEMADEHVLEIGQRAAGLQQPIVRS